MVEREARLERLRRTARRRLGVHIMPHVPDRYAFPTKVRNVLTTIKITFSPIVVRLYRTLLKKFGLIFAVQYVT